MLANSYEWVFVTPIPKFSQYDQVDRVDVSDEVGERLSECHVGRQVHALLLQNDLTKALETTPPPPVAIVTAFRLLPGKAAEYRELAKSYILPAMNRIDAAGYEVYRSIFGGPVQWVTVRFADSLAEVDKGPSLRRGLDENTYDLVVQKLEAIQMDVERSIQTLDTELSFFPKASSSSNE